MEPHERHLSALGVESLRVRTSEDLNKVNGLILPGGESTTMGHLLKVFAMEDAVRERAQKIPYWGICAGSILMAKEIQGKVKGPGQAPLGIMDLVVERNAYGRQLESFTAPIEIDDGSREASTFIRAPKFASWGANVKVRGRYQGEAVFLDEGRHMVTAFHPELSENLFFHKLFLARAQEN